MTALVVFLGKRNGFVQAAVQPCILSIEVRICDSLNRHNELEVVGEAANRLPAELRAKYPDVEWRKIIGMRNVLIHGYDIVQREVLWDTVRESVPNLLDQVNQILRDLEKQ
jgi:uncharacterized protein with HEPN domain